MKIFPEQTGFYTDERKVWVTYDTKYENFRDELTVKDDGSLKLIVLDDSHPLQGRSLTYDDVLTHLQTLQASRNMLAQMKSIAQ